MQTKSVIFKAPGVVELASTDLDAGALGDDQVLIETEASVVSPGTELAILGGGESWAPLPYVPGYGSVGRVVDAGRSARVRPGDRIFTHGAHTAFALSSNLVVPVPEGLAPTEACIARLAQVSITALRVAQAQLGDFVVVMGLGAIGNLAAQLFTLAGCEVIGVDLVEGRRGHARSAGVRHVLTPSSDLRAQVQEITRGRLARTVVEATGSSSVALQAVKLAVRLGELILLGSPRSPCQTDLTPFLAASHLWDPGCITIKGAHEWRLPVTLDPTGRQPHSMEGNVENLLDLLLRRRLDVSAFLEHVVAPEQAPAIYAALAAEKDRYLAAVFDWSRR